MSGNPPKDELQENQMGLSIKHADLVNAVEQVTEYLSDERADYETMIHGDAKAEHHIYHAVQTLEEWLDLQREKSPIHDHAADHFLRTENTNLPACGCGGQLCEIDRSGRSTTARCDGCAECFLIVAEGRGDPAVIWLRHFDQRRGEGLHRRPLDDQTMAERMMVALAANCWPSSATVADFGIKSSRQFEALQNAARAGTTAYELDRVLGDGKAITELVRATTPDPTLHVRFRTPFDDLYELNQHAGHEARTAAAATCRPRQRVPAWRPALDRDAFQPDIDVEPEIKEPEIQR